MKKIGIVAVLLLVVIALLPIIGNKSVSSEIDARLDALKKHGLAIKEVTDSGTYMTTKKHYEFVLKDSKAFLDYLSSQYSADQIPPYVNSVLDGIVLGADVEYSNIPFFTTIIIDLYPVKFAPDITQDLETSDPVLYKHLNEFLASKGLVYHMSYHISSDAFEGNLKDVERTFETKDGIEMKLVILNTKFGGVGPLVAPKESFFNMGKLSVDFDDKQTGKMIVAFEDLQSHGSFASKTKYNSNISMKNVKVVVDDKGNSLYFNMDNVKNSYVLDTKENKTDISGTMALQNFVLKTKQGSVKMESFNYDMALVGLDAPLFEEIQTAVTKERSNPTVQGSQNIKEKVIDLLSKGFTFKVNTLDAKKIVRDEKKEYGDVHLDANLVLKADPQLKEKIRFSPMGMAGDVTFNASVHLSETFFNEVSAMAPMLQNYAKKENGKVIFDIKFEDSKLTLNSQPL